MEKKIAENEKLTDTIREVSNVNMALQMENERLRLEYQKIEQQKIKQEMEQRDEEKQNREKTERLLQENKETELKNRTVRGVLYSTLSEADNAREEHNQIDILKEKLMLVKSQEKRVEIFRAFKYEFQFADPKRRYELLKLKIETPVPRSEKYINIYGISVLITFFIYLVLNMNEGLTGILLGISMGCFIWSSFGVWIWVVWKIVLKCKRKKKNYYKNIEDI